MFFRHVHRSRFGRIKGFHIRLSGALVVAISLGLAVLAAVNPPVWAEIITLKDAYQDLPIVARHAVAAGQDPSAVNAAYARALGEQRGNANTRLEYARWLDTTTKKPEAVAILRQGLTKPPYDPELSAQLAWALAESSPNLDEARKWLKHALDSQPGSPYLADTAAWIDYREGKYREAFELIRPSLSLVDEIPEVAYHAGAIHAQLGNTAEAIRYLRKALQPRTSFPGDRQAKELLAQLEL